VGERAGPRLETGRRRVFAQRLVIEERTRQYHGLMQVLPAPIAERHGLDKIKTIGDAFECEERGTVEVKGRGPMRTFWLVGRA